MPALLGSSDHTGAVSPGTDELIDQLVDLAEVLGYLPQSAERGLEPQDEARALGDLPGLLQDCPLLVVCLHQTVVDSLGESLDGGVLRPGVLLLADKPPPGRPSPGSRQPERIAGGHGPIHAATPIDVIRRTFMVGETLE